MKVCGKCAKELPLESFHLHKTGKFGRHPWCKSCVSMYYKGRYPEKWAKERVQRLAKMKEYRIRVKEEVFTHYSGGPPKCVCCGESEIKFLSLDHKNNDGNIYRRSGGKGGSQMYAKIKKQGYPEHFQVLCYNCNCAKGFYGECPHLSYKSGSR